MASESAERPLDLPLALLAIGLVLFGLVMVYSASSPLALKRFHDPTHYALRNGIYAFLGIVVLAVTSRLSMETIRNLGKVGFWVGLVLLILVLIPGIGAAAGGARRWINLGLFTVQPSEPFKVVLVLYVAHFLALDPSRVTRFKGGIFSLMALFMVVAALLLAEPDFGTTMIIATVLFGMVFVAGIPIFWIVSLILISVPAAATAVLMAEYRLRRVTSFLDPWDDPRGSDFQLVQSLLAFGNGGVAGQGLGQGSQKQFYLPEAHTDFILAVIGEELGLFWVLVLVGFFALLVWRIFAIARRSEDLFVRLAVTGLGIMIGTQAMANMGVVMGLLPPKGLTLPFVSYGGTSLIITMGSVGLLLAFSRTVAGNRRS